MRIEMPIAPFVALYRMASVGKLIQGLVHNLNGPLQNLGMDMEMMQYALGSDKRLPKELSDSFMARLQRMEAEFDQVTRLIKSSAMRLELEGDDLPGGDIKYLLEQEVSFLHADLYFKHNVQKQIQISEELAHVSGLPREVPHALCWFVQAVVEEMEKGEATGFTLSGRSISSAVEIGLCIEGEEVGHTCLENPPMNPVPAGHLTFHDGVGVSPPLAFLRLHGVSIACKRKPEKLEFMLTIPCPGASSSDF